MPRPNALILDPTSDSGDRLASIKNLMTVFADWKITQLSFYESQQDPVSYADKVIEAVKNADVVLCFGNFFWFKFMSGLGDIFYVEIEKKLSSAVPFYFEIPRISDSIKNGSNLHHLSKLLRRLEVLPTENRVFSDLDYLDEHQSGTSIWFRKSDKCFLNPIIFNQVSEVLLSNSNIIEYDGDTFPILETSPLQFLVDSGDLKVASPFGKKGCVAVMRQTQTEFALVFSGHFLNDTVETLGGALHGFDINFEVAKHILSLLGSKIPSSLNKVLCAYKDFHYVETNLGNLIYNEIFRDKSESEKTQIVPNRVIENITHNGKLDFAFACYFDLVEILLHNWNFFKEIFGISKFEFNSIFRGINFRARRYLAHPHKAAQSNFEFDEEDLIKIKKARLIVSNALAKRAIH